MNYDDNNSSEEGPKTLIELKKTKYYVIEPYYMDESTHYQFP